MSERLQHQIGRARPLQVETVRTDAGLHALEREWVELESSARVKLPFRTYAWNAAWWQTMAESKVAVSDRLDLRVVRDASTGALVGVAPMVLTSMPSVGPLQIKALQFFGADPNITEIRGMVCADDDQGAVVAALRNELRKEREGWDWIAWEGLVDGPCADLDRASDVRFREATESYVLPLGASWDELRRQASRNLKESLRHCYNSLRRDSLSHELQVAQSWPEVELALPLFFRMHSARSVLSGHTDVFASPCSRAFLREVCRSFCARDQMRVFVLNVRGVPVAMRLGFAVGGSLYLYYSGYEPAYARYGVMTTCLAETLRYAIDRGFDEVNLSTGRDVSKLRWRPARVVYRAAVEVAPSRRARWTRASFQLAQRALADARLGQAAKSLFGRRR
jgi:CelD/BcsL family acetyltransferase involved in cellulose biosynthesis